MRMRPRLVLLLAALSVAAVTFDLLLRASIDLTLPISSPPSFRGRSLNLLRQAIIPNNPRSIVAIYSNLSKTEVHDLNNLEATMTAIEGGNSHDSFRGFVLPLDDASASLGFAMLLGLRLLGREAASVPVEFAYCGSQLARAQRLAFTSFFPLGPVSFVDVCAAATTSSSSMYCNDDSDCQVEWSGNFLRAAAVVFSNFDELVLLDSASLFFRDPALLFHDAAYRRSGALFFPSFKLSTSPNSAAVDLSLVVWHKHSLRNATSILAELLTYEEHDGDDLLWAACKSANADCAISSTTPGVVGSAVSVSSNTTRTPLCGATAHFSNVNGNDPRLLFVSGRAILSEIVRTDKDRSPPTMLLYTNPFSPPIVHIDDNSFSCALMPSPVLALSKPQLENFGRLRLHYQHVLDWSRAVGDWVDDKGVESESRLADRVRARVSILVAAEEQLAYSLHQLSQRASAPRGIVLPLYDKIAPLGVSLILQLRQLGVDLPIEIPHCGDIAPEIARIYTIRLNDLGSNHSVRFYDACAVAVQETSALFPSRALFCRTLDECHRKFRGFDIKVLGVVLSQFQQIMLLDADTLFFQNPTLLFNTTKFDETGTLFFHDRICSDTYFMSQRLGREPRQTIFHDYMLGFDAGRFHAIPTMARGLEQQVDVLLNPNAVLPDTQSLSFTPSQFLLGSHVWNVRSGHQMDSSCVLWDKKRQPRATAVLASFVARNDIRAPPSYGDKELFFVACEVAEARYAFSDFGIGAVGTFMIDSGPERSVVCGDMSQNVPEWNGQGHSPLLYINSDSILNFDPDRTAVYYTQPRAAAIYPGPFKWRPECPFNITAVAFSDAERASVYARQKLNAKALSWLQSPSD